MIVPKIDADANHADTGRANAKQQTWTGATAEQLRLVGRGSTPAHLLVKRLDGGVNRVGWHAARPYVGRLVVGKATAMLWANFPHDYGLGDIRARLSPGRNRRDRHAGYLLRPEQTPQRPPTVQSETAA